MIVTKIYTSYNFVHTHLFCLQGCCNHKLFSCTSSRARKAYLVLTCGPPSTQTILPKGKGADGEMCSDDSGDEESERVS